MTPTSLGLLLASYPPERRGGAVRTWTAIGGLAAALGPVVGGVLLTASWRWIFIVNVPIGLAALVVGWRMLPRVPGHDVPRPDAWGAALVTVGVARSPSRWSRSTTGVGARPASASASRPPSSSSDRSSCTACAPRNPLVEPGLFRIRPFVGASLAMLPFAVAFGAMLLSIVLWEQGTWGWSALEERAGDRAGAVARAHRVAADRRPPDPALRPRPGGCRGTSLLRRRRRRGGRWPPASSRATRP